MTRVLSQRALNRATLSRQLLLARQDLSALEAVRRLLGLNAQTSEPPYIGLWSRLTDFAPDSLAALLHDRTVVRSCLMRCTQHFVAATDYPMLRPLVEPVLARAQRNAFGQRTVGVDLAELASVASDLLAGHTLTRPELGRRLAERWPDHDGSGLAWSAQYLLPLVHPPPDGMWGRRGGPTTLAHARDWLGTYQPSPDPSALVLRYLAAFGPAMVRDIHAWSGLSGLQDVVDSLRPRLRTFENDEGKELFDLPDAPRPNENVPAPPRFLPELDNLMLAYANRRRIMCDEYRARVCAPDIVAPTLLVDGAVHGMWKVDRARESATLRIDLFEPLPSPMRARVRAEGRRLLAFVAPDVKHSVVFAAR